MSCTGTTLLSQSCYFMRASDLCKREWKKYVMRKDKCEVSYQHQMNCRTVVDSVWNVMTHVQQPDFVFWLNGRVHLNRRGNHFTQLLAGELCTSACRVCTAHASLCSAVMWRLLVTHSIPLFPLHFSSCVSRVPSHIKRNLLYTCIILA
jgi:hypothetical protein